MIFALGLAAAALTALPHALRLERAAPGPAIAIWLSALIIQALSVALAAIYLLFFFPHSGLFQWITRWCWHAVIPFVATHLGLNGHTFGDAAVVMPAILLAGSLLSAGWGLRTVTRAIRRWRTEAAVGEGPQGSVIVRSPTVVIAAAGLARPQIVVSGGALIVLDDAELAAGLAHERGHIERDHRFILLIAEISRSLGRFLPGSRRALRELVFHLERDADQFALARDHDSLALASAICKAATTRPQRAFWLSFAGGHGIPDRVRQLSERSRPLHVQSGTRVIATGMAAVAIAMAAMVPVALAAGKERLADRPPVHWCPK